MSTVKEEARKIIDSLPEDVTWDDLIYELHVRQKIELGLRAADEGRAISHEQVKQRFLSA